MRLQSEKMLRGLRVFLFILMICSKMLYAGGTPYISPGVRFGYIIGQGFSASAKISFGIAFGKKDDFNNYVNLTFGSKKILSEKTGAIWPNSYKYTEVQFGTVQKDLKGYLGGSIGYFNPIDDQPVVGSRWSIYYGGFGFGSLEVESFGEKPKLYDLGLSGVLPIPPLMLFGAGSF